VQIINANVLLDNFAGNLTLNTGDILAGNIATNGVLNIAGPVSVNAALTNWGTVNWQAGSMVLNNNGASFTGSIWNEAGALWNIQCDQVMDNGGQYQLGQFQNAGTVIKSAGTNTTTFSQVFFANSGSVQAQTGTIQFNWGYSDSSSANLAVSLGGAAPASGYGKISFSSPLSLDGTFTVSTPKGYLPSPGDTFHVLTYPSSTNSFTCLSGLDLGGGILLQPQFGSAGLTLLATAYTINASQPQLFINRTLGGVAIIWPVGFPDWTLQSSTNLSSPAWTAVSNACVNQIVVPTSAPQQYFRLNKN
jgi:hypothetical protein